MTSSASTGRCPSCITPPPSTVGSRADPGNACGASSDPEALEGLGELIWVVQLLGVGRPRRWNPDLGVVAGTDDDGVGAEVDVLPEIRGQEDPPLAVELDLGRAGEDQAREATSVRIGDREGRDLRRQLI